MTNSVCIVILHILGVKGLVSDSSGSLLRDANVTVADRDIPSYTSQYGEYWRILLPGTYKLTVSFIVACLACWAGGVSIQVNPRMGHGIKGYLPILPGAK